MHPKLEKLLQYVTPVTEEQAHALLEQFAATGADNPNFVHAAEIEMWPEYLERGREIRRREAQAVHMHV